jgi:hypothetical protein
MTGKTRFPSAARLLSACLLFSGVLLAGCGHEENSAAGHGFTKMEVQNSATSGNKTNLAPYKGPDAEIIEEQKKAVATENSDGGRPTQ